MPNFNDLFQIIDDQDTWRNERCLNLIASENVQSPGVKKLMVSDFVSRYAEGHPNTEAEMRRYYQGTTFIDRLETMAASELRDLLGCSFVDVRPISGNMANIALFFSLLSGGDAAINVSSDAGGHISALAVGSMGRVVGLSRAGLEKLNGSQSDWSDSLKEAARRPNLHSYPMTPDGYHIDLDKTRELFDRVRPRAAVVGRSLFLFPEPVAELAEICRKHESYLVYDAAHVFGLIAGGRFQQPLQEGADLMSASAHKTFPGPQRAIIASNLPEDDPVLRAVDRGVFPGSSSNHHLFNIPPLIGAVREMKEFGREYADQTIKNAQALASALDALGMKVEGKEFGFTQSHQVALDVSPFGSARDAARNLEQNDIIVNFNLLPGDSNPKKPRGLRIGVQEMTRFGMMENQMEAVAGFIHEVTAKGRDVRKEVNAFRADFLDMKYC